MSSLANFIVNLMLFLVTVHISVLTNYIALLAFRNKFIMTENNLLPQLLPTRNYDFVVACVCIQLVNIIFLAWFECTNSQCFYYLHFMGGRNMIEQLGSFQWGQWAWGESGRGSLNQLWESVRGQSAKYRVWYVCLFGLFEMWVTFIVEVLVVISDWCFPKYNMISKAHVTIPPIKKTSTLIVIAHCCPEDTKQYLVQVGGTFYDACTFYYQRPPSSQKMGWNVLSPKNTNSCHRGLNNKKVFMLLSQLFTYFICKDHQAIVCFAPDGPTHTLSRMAHRIKRQEVIFPDLKLISEVFQSCLIQENRSGFFISSRTY